MKKVLLTIAMMIIAFASSFAQSRASYDASFFKTEDQQAAIEVGKGFNITDPFTPTRNCFTGASRDISLTKRQQQGGGKTNVKVYYTRDDYEYNKFNSNHYSANASFANIFSVSADMLNEMTSVSSKKTERLIFVATIDFGNYFYQDEPVLTPEAQKLLDEGNFELFKSRYGSHYVSGYGKSSSIKVVLTRNMSSDEIKNTLQTGIGANLNYNGQSYGVSNTNRTETGQKFTQSGFTVDIELEGPTIPTKQMKTFIEGLQNEPSLIDAVTDYMTEALKALNDESEAWITRYFFSDFTLYGCKDIKWNVAKERKLSSINENYLDMVRLSKLSNKHIENNSIDVVFKNLEEKGKSENVFAILLGAAFADQDNYTKTIEEYQKKTDALKGEWQKLKTDADNMIPKLKRQYSNCSDLSCDVDGICCNSVDYSTEIKRMFDKYNSLNSKVNGIFQEMIENLEESSKEAKEIELSTPTVREATCKIFIKNRSSHPYSVVYVHKGTKHYLAEHIKGGGTYELEVEQGYYEFEATQKSGYTFYPTIDKRTLRAEANQTYTITIGYDNN